MSLKVPRDFLEHNGVILLGGSGHARSIGEVLSELGIEVKGYVAMEEAPTATSPWLGPDLTTAMTTKRQLDSCGLVLAVGNNKIREATWLEALHLNLRIVQALVSPRAFVASDVRLAEGSVVMPGAMIRTGVSIGRGAVVNTGAIIDHDCRLGDFVHAAPGTVLAGCVTLGHGAFVGAGACILPDVEMGDWSTAGSGSVVTRNVAQGSTVVGSPARPFSKP